MQTCGQSHLQQLVFLYMQVLHATSVLLINQQVSKPLFVASCIILEPTKHTHAVKGSPFASIFQAATPNDFLSSAPPPQI